MRERERERDTTKKEREDEAACVTLYIREVGIMQALDELL